MAVSLNERTVGASISPFVDRTEFVMSQPVFRPHPHAGFSAVTYMFEDSAGTFMNRWSKGGSSLIGPGTLHWTHAGSGMMHEEIPTEPGVPCHGLQMFVKLAAADELSPPAAFHLDADQVVELAPSPGVRLRLLAGSLSGAEAGIAIRNQLTLVEAHLDGGASVELPAPEDTTAFVFVQRGTISAATTTVNTRSAATFAGDGDHVAVTAVEPVSFLFGTGRPLGEPALAQGPFIMSTQARLDEAFAAFKRGDMGHLDASF